MGAEVLNSLGIQKHKNNLDQEGISPYRLRGNFYVFILGGFPLAKRIHKG
jgi:hypothetical protein